MCVDHFLLPRLYGPSRPLTKVPHWEETGLVNWPATPALLGAVFFGRRRGRSRALAQGGQMSDTESPVSDTGLFYGSQTKCAIASLAPWGCGSAH
jgi:hypothetical protein